jgi:hypothetical protein
MDKKFVVIDLNWLPHLHEQIIWNDDYSKLMDFFNLQDVIQYLLGIPVIPPSIEIDGDIYDWLLSYFPLDELNEESMVKLRDFTCDVVNVLASMLYTTIYELMMEKFGEYRFAQWIDYTSLILEDMGTVHWDRKAWEIL